MFGRQKLADIDCWLCLTTVFFVKDFQQNLPVTVTGKKESQVLRMNHNLLVTKVGSQIIVAELSFEERTQILSRANFCGGKFY